jgi:hypothetical protein
MSNQAQQNAAVLLVYAAGADGSSWSKVIPELRGLGLQVVSTQIPLTPLTEVSNV